MRTLDAIGDGVVAAKRMAVGGVAMRVPDPNGRRRAVPTMKVGGRGGVRARRIVRVPLGGRGAVDAVANGPDRGRGAHNRECTVHGAKL
jgi:hypothetical protein